MKLLITGGLGFIGTNFIRYWFEKHPDDSIVNLDKVTYAANPANLTEFEGKSNYKFIKGDICDIETCKLAMDGVDLIVHFAAETHVDRSIDEPAVFLHTNVLGTYNLLACAKEKNIRFHHISTDEVFGALELDDPNKFTEKTVYNPRSPYSAAKASSDLLVRSFFTSFELPITISNCSNNYGPYQSPEKLIPRMITNILTGQKVKLYGDGLNVRDWLHVLDHCRAIEAIVTKGKIGETYVVGGLDKDINNLELTKTVLKMMGKSEDQIEFVSDRPGHDRRYAVNFSKIKNELGWSPQYTFQDGMKATIDWYTKNEKWWQASKTEAEQFYKKIGR